MLDLVPVTEGSHARTSFANMVELARLGERLGYKRFWLAEHHNMPGIASAATAVLIGHVAGATTTIRVGAGGIMLPNHAPLQVAEQFGTLATLYPGRVDLGLGRAPGTDQAAARALRRYYQAADEFPRDVIELMQYFDGAARAGSPRRPGSGGRCRNVDPRFKPVRRTAGRATGPAVFLRVAFRTGLARAGTGNLSQLVPALGALCASARHAGLNVVVADSDAEARRLFTSQQLGFINLRRGRPGLVQPPVDDIDAVSTPAERIGVDAALACAVVGSRVTARKGLEAFIGRHGPDELLLTANVFEHAARLRSFEMAAAIFDEFNAVLLNPISV